VHEQITERAALNIRSTFTGAVIGLCAVAACATAHAQSATAWVEGYNSKTRMVAGTVATTGGAPRVFAGVEITMPDGWKTYWRNPGDAGGVPPYFDWAGSENLATAKVLYPQPSRLKDASGDSVGYKKAVVFPIEVTAKDPAKPVKLNLAMEFGVCREICVPAEAKLSLNLPTASTPPPPALTAALDMVPRKGADRRPGDPELKALRATLTGDKPKLEIDVAFTGDGAGADVFVEAPDGIYLNLPRKIGANAGPLQTFEVDLATGIEVGDLKGKMLLVTMVSAAGQSEATWKVD
jgi:DsbC/DsbD-like thiol-disulfide interchange protein